MSKTIKQIENRINKIKQSLLNIGEMRPGSLTRQYPKADKSKQGYYQISYTYKMKSRTEYVKEEFIRQLKHQVITFKKFKKLIQEWIDLSIEHSKLKIKFEKKKKK